MQSNAAPVTEPSPTDGPPQRRAVRRWMRSEPEPLSFMAMRIAVRLGDAGVSVRTVATRFPHVLNRVGAAWANPATASEVVEDLLVDRRGGRRGFPPEALEELHALRELCAVRRQANAARPSLR